MVLSELFKTLRCSIIAQQTAFVQNDFENQASYAKFAREISNVEKNGEGFVLTRKEGAVCFGGIEGSFDCLKLLSKEDFANLNLGDLPANMATAVELLVEYAFFRL